MTMTRAKMSGTYPNSVLATLEATQHGYDEGLLLDVDGFVAEGFQPGQGQRLDGRGPVEVDGGVVVEQAFEGAVHEHAEEG